MGKMVKMQLRDVLFRIFRLKWEWMTIRNGNDIKSMRNGLLKGRCFYFWIPFNFCTRAEVRKIAGIVHWNEFLLFLQLFSCMALSCRSFYVAFFGDGGQLSWRWWEKEGRNNFVLPKRQEDGIISSHSGERDSFPDGWKTGVGATDQIWRMPIKHHLQKNGGPSMG